MALPNDITKRQTIAAYLKDAVSIKQKVKAENVKLKEIFEAIKDSEDHLEFTLSEFKEALAALIAYTKTQERADKLQSAIETVDILKL